MDPKHTLLCSGGNRGIRGPGVGTLPSFCPAEWTLSAAALFSPRSWRTRRVRGLVVVLMLLLLQTSLASDGKTDAAAPLLPVRVPPPQKKMRH